MIPSAHAGELAALLEEIEGHDAPCSTGESRFVQACRRIVVAHGTLDDDEVDRLQRILERLDRRASGEDPDLDDDDDDFDDDDEFEDDDSEDYDDDFDDDDDDDEDYGVGDVDESREWFDED